MKITYITYQGIPSTNTYAHGIWTFSIIKHLVKKNYEVDLVFPLREKNSTSDVSKLQDYYEMNLDFEVNPTKHYLPFGRINIFTKYMYIFSHILWAYYVTKDGVNITVLESGFDQDLFYDSSSKHDKIKIVYSGNLQRFGKSRGVVEIIEYFLESKYSKSSELHIFGGPDDIANNLNSQFKSENVYIHGHVKRSELAAVLSEAQIGILTNDDSIHSQRHTSPMKYYEYLGSGMNVIATNSLAHKDLPIQYAINYFDLNDKESFFVALDNAIKNYDDEKVIDVSKLTMDYRMNKFIDFVNARPEGLEPSTP